MTSDGVLTYYTAASGSAGATPSFTQRWSCAANGDTAFAGNATSPAYISTGPNSGYYVTRRDTTAATHLIKSDAGEFAVLSFAAGSNVLAIDGPTSAAQFLGTVGTGFSTTVLRPSGPTLGAQWYDTTIHRPIWFDGSNWRDAAGNVV